MSEQVRQALAELMKHFPTDTDMLDLEWPKPAIEAACAAYDSARSALSQPPEVKEARELAAWNKVREEARAICNGSGMGDLLMAVEDYAQACVDAAPPTAASAGVPSEPVKRWPFVESPGDFTERLREALREFDGHLLPAVRNVLIENPPTLVAPPPAPALQPLTQAVRSLLETLGQPNQNDTTHYAVMPGNGRRFSLAVKQCWRALKAEERAALAPQVPQAPVQPATEEKVRALVEAALWWAYCPTQGGYRHDGERDGRSMEDTCEALIKAAEAFTGFPVDDSGAAWASEEDAESMFAPALRTALSLNDSP